MFIDWAHMSDNLRIWSIRVLIVIEGRYFKTLVLIYKIIMK